jgi:hypothetical protein
MRYIKVDAGSKNCNFGIAYFTFEDDFSDEDIDIQIRIWATDGVMLTCPDFECEMEEKYSKEIATIWTKWEEISEEEYNALKDKGGLIWI